MAIVRSKSVSFLFAAVVSAAFLAGGAFAADAPAPSPASAAGSVSPPLAVAVLAASSVALIIGSLRH